METPPAKRKAFRCQAPNKCRANLGLSFQHGHFSRRTGEKSTQVAAIPARGMSRLGPIAEKMIKS